MPQSSVHYSNYCLELTRIKIMWNVMGWSFKYISALRIFRDIIERTDVNGRMGIRAASERECGLRTELI